MFLPLFGLILEQIVVFKSTRLLCAALLLALLSIAQAQQPEVYVQQGPDTVTALAVSRDGRLLATGSRTVQSDVIRLYDLKVRRELRTLRHFEVQSLAFSPDGNWLASAGRDEKQTLVQSSFGDFLKTIYSVRLWDVKTGNLLRTIATSDTSFHDIVFNPDGQFLAASSGEKTKLWDVAAKTEPRVIQGKSSALRLALSSDGKTLAGETYEHEIKLWDLATGADKFVLTGHKENIHALRFSPDSRILVSGSYDKTIRIWDVEKGALSRTLSDKSTVEDVFFLPDGQSFLSVSGDRVRRWKTSTGDVQDLFKEPSMGLEAARFTPDGSFLVSAGYQEIIVSDTASTTSAYTFTKRGGNICALWMLNDENTQGLIAEDFTSSNIWDYNAGEYRGAINGNAFCNSGTGVLSPDRKLVAVADQGGVALLDAQTRSPLRKIETGQSYLTTYNFTFSPDSRLLAAGGMDGITRILDVTSGKTISSINHNAPPKKIEVAPGVTVSNPASMFPNVVGRMAFSPDSKILAGAVADGSSFTNLIIFWDPATGQELRRLAGHDESATALAFSPDGGRFASGDGSGSIKLWDPKTGKEVRTLRGHKGSINALLFAPRDVLISGGGDAQIKLWDVLKDVELISLVSLNAADWLAVTPDGLFDGSPDAWSAVLWRFSPEIYDVAPVEIFFNEYFYPNLLEDILAGKRPAASKEIKDKDRRQPSVGLTLPGEVKNARVVTSLPIDSSVSNARNITVRVTLSEAAPDSAHPRGSGVGDVRLFRNGSLVKAWRGETPLHDGQAVLETTLPVVAGSNRLTAYAFNRENIKSADAVFTVEGAAGLKRAGVAYVLAIGINEYANSHYSLKYAVADARAFVAEIEEEQSKLAQFERIEVSYLNDTEATKANIMRKLEELAKKTEPEDLVMIYFAGHGTAQQNRFFLVPHDLAYKGSRTALDRAGLQEILDHSISDIELERALEGVDGSNVVLIIDACNSGQALESEEKRRGPMNSHGLAQLAYEKGMYVLTASQSYQAAIGSRKLGHGYLTYALIEEGLKQHRADEAPADGQVLLREWLAYATRRVPDMQNDEAQEIRDLVQPEAPNNSQARAAGPNAVQRPRVFYRRELEHEPLIIAKP